MYVYGRSAWIILRTPLSRGAFYVGIGYRKEGYFFDIAKHNAFDGVMDLSLFDITYEVCKALRYPCTYLYVVPWN